MAVTLIEEMGRDREVLDEIYDEWNTAILVECKGSGCASLSASGGGSPVEPPEGYTRVNGFKRYDDGQPGGAIAKIPEPGPVTDLRICEGVIYATVGKKVFALKGADWQLAFTLD